MNNYRYSLDKSSKKFHCPLCLKKTFVKYVDTVNGGYIQGDIGRCDRENKCGYHLSPKGNKPLDNVSKIYIPPKPSFHDDRYIGYFGNNYNNNNFVTFLKTKFAPVDIKQAIERYFIGTSNHWNGSTVFWQVDEQMRIRAGKVMLYNLKDGKRVKQPFRYVNWIHKVTHKFEKGKFNVNVKDNKPFVLQQCLFGLHCLHDETNKTIAIVESEKTAIIMSIFYPCYVWMATGSRSNFKSSLLQPLKGRKIIAFPDKTEYEDWSIKTFSLRKEGFNIVCSELIEQKNLEEGSDLIDFVLN